MSAYYGCDKVRKKMNFDLNALANLMQIFQKSQNTGASTRPHPQNKPCNAPNSFDKSKGGNLYKNSSFAAQNGLGEEIGVESFSPTEQNQAEKDGAKSPMENILSIMSKKKDIEKMMPAFASIFSKSQPQSPSKVTKTEEMQSENGKSPENPPPNHFKQKENGKPEDLFSPIEFAGYTLVSALNRLYFNSKNQF